MEATLEKIKTKKVKINRTYSLSKAYVDLLNKIYIKRLQKGLEVDKSDIICEGIQLVFDKEFK